MKILSNNFNIYYLNFTKTYEIAMMINNVLLTNVQKEEINSTEKSNTSIGSFNATAPKQYLDSVKATLSSESNQTTFSSSKVVETLDVKTTKSILLQKVIDNCNASQNLSSYKEGDLLKLNNIKFEILDEDSLRQFLILRRDALKGFRVEGIELNNLINSMLQDYSYIPKGTISNDKTNDCYEIVIKIPLEIQSEFENKYSINDLLIGHVSVIGIFKGIVEEEFISSNTFAYFQEAGLRIQHNSEDTEKIIKSNTYPDKPQSMNTSKSKKYYFIDTIAIIQDVNVKVDEQNPKFHWWNKIGLWLFNLRRK